MDKITGNSCAIIDQLRKEGVKPDQLKLIYNGVGQIKAGRPSTGFTMVMTANLLPYKGHVDLFHALA